MVEGAHFNHFNVVPLLERFPTFVTIVLLLCHVALTSLVIT
jgi:hypothetical protein